MNGFDFAVSYLDDILMKSQSLGEHKEYVHKVFAKIQDYGFKLKESKRDFLMEKIRYLGHIIDWDGRRPDPDGAAVIKDMPASNNIATLQSFIGLANYYQIFIPNRHDLRALLNELLKIKQLWMWTKECPQAFEKMKKILTSDLFLTHYNPGLEIIVANDASSYGIGACILHKMTDGATKPIAYALRALLPTEKNYSQIEKEDLPIIPAVSKFHRFIHDRYFILQTP